MGFRNWLESRVYYHGTPHDFVAFRLQPHDRSGRQLPQDSGIWFSDNESIARGYGCVRNGEYCDRPTVIVARLHFKRPLVLRSRDSKITDETIRQLKHRGYDAVIRVLDGEKEFCVFDPSQVEEVERRQEPYEDFKRRLNR